MLALYASASNVVQVQRTILALLFRFFQRLLAPSVCNATLPGKGYVRQRYATSKAQKRGGVCALARMKEDAAGGNPTSTQEVLAEKKFGHSHSRPICSTTVV
eukprot:5070928-Amphidinium_carterae.1